jgi:hypothetical protein
VASFRIEDGLGFDLPRVLDDAVALLF